MKRAMLILLIAMLAGAVVCGVLSRQTGKTPAQADTTPVVTAAPTAEPAPTEEPAPAAEPATPADLEAVG